MQQQESDTASEDQQEAMLEAEQEDLEEEGTDEMDWSKSRKVSLLGDENKGDMLLPDRMNDILPAYLAVRKLVSDAECHELACKYCIIEEARCHLIQA